MIKLVRTRLRRKILSYIFSNIGKEFFVRELAKIISEDAGNCSRELKRFEQTGILTVQSRGRAKFYTLNPDYPQLAALRALLAKEEEHTAPAQKLLFLCETKLRRKLFAHVLRHRTATFYVRELAALIQEDPGNLSRELKLFEQEGIFTSYTRANARFYQLCQNHPLVDDLAFFLSKSDQSEEA